MNYLFFSFFPPFSQGKETCLPPFVYHLAAAIVVTQKQIALNLLFIALILDFCHSH